MTVTREQVLGFYNKHLGTNPDEAALNHQLTSGLDAAQIEANIKAAAPTARDVNAQQINNPTMPQGTQFTPTMQTPNAGETMQGPGSLGELKLDPATGTASTAAAPAPINAAQMTASTIGNNTPTMTAAQGTVSQNAQVVAQQGTLSDGYNQNLAQRGTEIDNTQLDPRATVQYQYEQLTSGDMNWAKGAVRQASAMMAARGISSSTMAGEAMTSAILQAALPIASQDAKAFQALQIEKMTQKQQLTIVKAGHLAAMDMQNLNNRQQAAVLNAQSFLQMDMKNLDMRQQSSVVNLQARVQTMMSDQAAENAARQFNAATKNDVDKFFAQLSTQVDMFNSTQTNAMTQFNVGQQNDLTKFQGQLNNQREMFNTQMRFAVEQSNVQYLRDINTRNTASINEANFINSQNLLKISNTAMANELLMMRDDSSFAWQSSENQLNRIENRALMLLNRDIVLGLMNDQQKYATGQEIGRAITSIVGGILKGT